VSRSSGEVDADVTDDPPARPPRQTPERSSAITGETPVPSGPAATFAGYPVIEPLARQQRRAAYLCDDPELERRVVVEVIDLDGDAAARFLAEARAVARCNHPHLATVYDLASDRGRPCLIREHVEGETLRAWLDRGRAPAGRRLEMLAQAARGLAHAHAHGLAHGALNAAAVRVARDGTVRLIDVGVARALAAATAGTVADLAAAQRADLGALAVLIEAALGAPPPWPSETAAAEVASQLERLARLAPGSTTTTSRRGGRRLAAVALLALVALIAALVVSRPDREARGGRGPAVDPAGPARVEAMRAAVAHLDAQGDPRGAQRLLDEFVADERDARAAAMAWILRGERLRSRPGVEGNAAAASIATGFALAPDPDTQRRALAALASVHHTRREWEDFAAAIDAYADAPGAATAEGERLLDDRHLLFRDRAAALASSVPATAAIAGRLFEGRPLPLNEPRLFDLDGDGERELLGVLDGAVVTLHPHDLRELARAALAPGDILSCPGRDRFGAFLYVITRHPDGRYRTRLQGFPEGPVIDLGSEVHRGCATLDADGDGGEELFLATNDGGILRIQRSHADRVASRRWHVGSTVTSIIGGDLDGDGRHEVVYSAAEWRAYDVRLARVDAADELVLVDRVRVGVVAAMGSLGRGRDGRARIAAFNIDAYPTAVRLPLHAPSGLPPGMATLVLAGDRLTLEAHTALDVPTDEPAASQIIAADLDGNGLDDVAVSASAAGTMLVLLARPQGGHDVRQVREVMLFATMGGALRDPTLLASVGTEKQMWILGGRGQPIPTVPRARRPAARGAPLSTLGDPALSAAWQRAERLAHIGQEVAAAAALRRVAAQAGTTSVRARALTRAAELLRRQQLRAGDVLEAAAELSRRPVDQRLDDAAAAIADDLAHGALGDAVTRAARLERTSLPADALRERLAALPLPAADTVAAFDGAELHPAWRIDHPLALDVVPGRGHLVVETLRDGTVAALGLAARGPGLVVTIEGQLTHMEWASELRVELAVPGEPKAGLAWTIGARGGGQRYRRVTFCRDETHTLTDASQPLPDADEVVPFRIELAVSRTTGRARCAVTVGDRSDARELIITGADAATWELRLGASPVAQLDLARTRIARITVRGASAVPGDVALAAATRDFVHHRHAAATAALAADTAGADRWAHRLLAVALAHELGDRAAARASLARALRGAAAERPSLDQLAELLRFRDGLLLPVVTDVLGGDAVPVIERALSRAAYHDLDEPLVRAEIVRAASALPASALASDQAQEVAAMYGEVLIASGRPQEGRRLLGRTMPSARPGDRATRAAYLLARDAAARGEPDEARRWALRSLALAPQPEQAADLILLEPGLAALARGPGWEPVVELGRALAELPEP
jgi:hypothetical protein